MKEKLLILGTGFAAIQIARNIDLKSYEVTIVSPRNYFLFTPLLASTAVGTLEFRSIIEPIRTARKGIQYIQGKCMRIDPAACKLFCKTTDTVESFEIGYDHLVIAVGSANNTFGVEGVEEHALFLKDIPDARAIRVKLLSCLEQASAPNLAPEERKRLLHFVVVGGGPTGVEFAGELNDFLVQDLAQGFPEIADELRVTLLEAKDRLLGTFDETLSNYTMRNFAARNIAVKKNTAVTRLREKYVELEDGTQIPFGLIVWSGGIAPTALVANSSFVSSSNSRIITNSNLEIEQETNIYAAGDCALVKGSDYPSTAQLAQQQGRYLAKALNRKAKGKTIKPFRYHHMGMLAYIGNKQALADTPGPKLRGFLAWLMWRSVYITKLVSFRNKVLVLFDWFKTKWFGRDISRF